MYELEELVPIVASLSRRWTENESSSISYETAEQLMGAVLYCIHVYEESGGLVAGKVSAQEAYEQGVRLVTEKVGALRELYHQGIACFCSFGNRALEETILEGLPAFFHAYDVRFAPQDSILTLDYPIWKDMHDYTGIERIFAYTESVFLEQKFLMPFGCDYVEAVLRGYDKGYKTMIENVCSIVLTNLLGHLFLQKPLEDRGFRAEEYASLTERLSLLGIEELEHEMRRLLSFWISRFYDGDSKLEEYLELDVKNIAVRVQEGVKYGFLERLFIL